ncbi:MAG: metal-dependent hydrolase [Rhodospirillales bacterium]
MLGDSVLGDAKMLAGAPEDVRRLWQWHAMEETEHKAVAFDVFAVVTKDWPRWRRYMTRVHAMALVSLQFTAHLTYYASLLLAADGMSRSRATFKVLWFLFGKPAFFRRGLRGYWDWYKPGFHPWDHDNQAMLDTWRQVFAAA